MRAGETVQPTLHPLVTINDNGGDVALEAGGLGVTSITAWACGKELAEGALVLVLPDWDTESLPIHAYFPTGRTTRMAARVFVDFIAEALREG